MDTLPRTKPANVALPAEPTYQQPIDNHADATERERSHREYPTQNEWEPKCQKLMEGGILCCEQPWDLCGRKCVSLLFLSIGTKGRRILNRKKSRAVINKKTTIELWKLLELSFFKPRNIMFDRNSFFSREQDKGETFEQYYSILKELAQNCNFANCEETVIRDVFIINIPDSRIQLYLLRETQDPSTALQTAINLEM